MAKKESLKKNFVYSICYQILVIILPLITAPYVTRVLGAGQLSIYSVSQAFANYFYLFAMLGINNYGNRTIARVRDDRDETSKAFWEMFSFQLITGIIVSAAYIVYSTNFLEKNSFIYVMQSFYVVSGIFDVNWFCFGIEKFKLTTMRSTIVRILTAVCVFVFVHDTDDLWIYTLIMSASFLVSALAVWPFVLKQVKFIKPDWNGIVKHIKPNLVLFWPVVAVSLYNIMDKLMLDKMGTDDEEVAFYTYAERIVQIPNTLILALDNVIMPRMSNIYASGEKSGAKKLMNSVMLFAMFASAAMAFGLAGVGRVFAPFFYGKSFTRCGEFIVMLSPILIFKSWAGALRTQYIIPTGKDKIYVFSLTAGAAVNLTVNFLLIPRLNGTGAVIGTILAELTVAFIQFFMTRHEIDIADYMKNGIGLCAIGFIMYFAVNALSSVSSSAVITMAVQICVGAVIYLVLSTFFMVKIRKEPVIINECLKILHIKKRF